MNHFTKKYEKNIAGILSGFDRLVIRGSLRMLCFQMGMLSFLQCMGVLLKNFGSFVEERTEMLKKASYQEAYRLNRPIEYLPSCNTKKEPIAREIAARDNVKSGLICILKCVEPCMSYEIFRNRETKKLELVPRRRQCLHIYHYWVDPVFGFMSARIQTRFPFSIQICLNGREFLARRMDEENIFYIKEDNCFTYIDNFQRAQQLMDSMLDIAWPKHLNQVVEKLNPAHHQIFAPQTFEYYWSAYQSETATDVVFHYSNELDRIYSALLMGCITNFSSGDVMHFLGKTLSATFKGRLNTDLKNLYQGTRIKHWVNSNSIKLYNKKGNILRVETTINNPHDFRVYRPKEGEPDGNLEWRPMRKGIADLHRRSEVSLACNHRYLDALATLDTDDTLSNLIPPVCKSIRRKKRSIRGLRPWTSNDLQLFTAINRGEFNINGFSNKDIRQQLFPQFNSCRKQKRRFSAKVTRMFSMLRAHGIIKKVKNRHRYHLTSKGREVINAILCSQNITIKQLNELAA
jgi:hypothetical protein